MVLTICLRLSDGVSLSIAYVDTLCELCRLQDSNVDVPSIQRLERRLQPPRQPRSGVQQRNPYHVRLIQTLQFPTALCLFLTILLLTCIVAPRVYRPVSTYT